eukprot:10648888-Alexandrium_andersonii.AAC.1
MSASLVGSEMCIRDRCGPKQPPTSPCKPSNSILQALKLIHLPELTRKRGCLLYTSDAADDM